MAAGQQLDSLITALEQSVAAGLTYFQGPGSQSEIKIGRYDARGVLCQLSWWMQVSAEGAESVAAGGAAYRIYASVDEMNARAVGRSAGKSMQKLVEATRQHQARLVKAARALPDANATVLVMGDGSGRSVVQRLETIAQHWQERVHELQALSAA